jgi:hypothetical protein
LRKRKAWRENIRVRPGVLGINQRPHHGHKDWYTDPQNQDDHKKDHQEQVEMPHSLCLDEM